MASKKHESSKQTPAERDHQSTITPDDKLRAAETWRKVAPTKFKDILDATAQ